MAAMGSGRGAYQGRPPVAHVIHFAPGAFSVGSCRAGATHACPRAITYHPATCDDRGRRPGTTPSAARRLPCSAPHCGTRASRPEGPPLIALVACTDALAPGTTGTGQAGSPLRPRRSRRQMRCGGLYPAAPLWGLHFVARPFMVVREVRPRRSRRQMRCGGLGSLDSCFRRNDRCITSHGFQMTNGK